MRKTKKISFMLELTEKELTDLRFFCAEKNISKKKALELLIMAIPSLDYNSILEEIERKELKEVEEVLNEQ